MDDEQSILAQAISRLPPHDREGDEVEGVLTKFVLVSEWVDTEGNHYLTKRSATGMGENIPHWEEKGLLHVGLFGDF